MAGRPGDRPDQLLAGDAHRQREPVVDPAGDGRDGQPGPALLGGGQQGRLVDHADRAAAAGHGDDRAGVGLAGPAYGLGERQVLGDREGTAGEVARHQVREPAPDLGGLERGGGAVPEEEADDEGQQEVEEVRLDAEELLLRERPEQHRERGDPAAPGGDDGAAVHAAGELPDRGLEHPAAVQREPRDEVEGADQQVAEGQPLDDHEQQPVGHHEPQPERAPPDGQRGQRADHRDPELLARLLAPPPRSR